MKKGIFTLILFCLFFTGKIFAQYIVAEDDAGNYSQSDFISQGNLGFGFSDWFTVFADGGYFRSAAGEQGPNSQLIDVDGNSFGLWANGFSDVGRLLSAQLRDGESLKFMLAYQYDNGNRGFTLCDGDWETESFAFNINNTGYTWSDGGSAPSTVWELNREFGFALHFIFTQSGNDINYLIIQMTNGTPLGSGTITGKNIDRIKFYVSGAGGGTGGNLYFNSLKTNFSFPDNVPATANVQIDGDVTLLATQTLTVNDLSIPEGNSFTLESTSEGTGSLIINGTCTDAINVQRFLTGGWDWHFLSSPVQNQKILGAENFIELPTLEDDDVDFYRFDETNTTNTPWINIKNSEGLLNNTFGTPINDPEFEDALGYLIAYEGNDRVKTFSGVPNSGISGNLITNTSAGQQGWNLVGNRFQSAVDWESTMNSKDALDNGFYYVYNQDLHAGAGGFEYFFSSMLPNGNSDNVNGKIPAMQAFYVKSKAGGGLFYLSPLARVHDDQQFFKAESDDNNLLKLQIQGGQYLNETKFIINDQSTPGADFEDASMLFSLSNEVPHIYSYVENEKLVVNNVPFPDDDYNLPLGIKVGNSDTYTITAIDIENFNSSILPVLEDTETGMEIDLRFNESYTFEVSEPGINNSRFILHMKTAVGVNELNQKPGLVVSQVGNELKFYNLEPGDYEVRIVDIMGRVVMKEKLRSERIVSLQGCLKAGAYIIRVTGEKGQWTRKIVLK